MSEQMQGHEARKEPPKSVWLVIQDDPRAVTLEIDGVPRVLQHGHHNLTWLLPKPTPQEASRGEGERLAEEYLDNISVSGSYNRQVRNAAYIAGYRKCREMRDAEDAKYWEERGTEITRLRGELEKANERVCEIGLDLAEREGKYAQAVRDRDAARAQAEKFRGENEKCLHDLNEYVDKAIRMRNALAHINEPIAGVSSDLPTWAAYWIANLYKLRDIARAALSDADAGEG